MCEVDLNLRLLREETVLAHLLALVVGERAAQLGGQRTQFAREGLPHRGRIPRLQRHQQRKARGPLHQGPKRRRIGMAHEQVPLPVPRHGPIRHRGRPLVDAEEVLDRPRLEPHLVGPTKPVPLAQGPDELPFKRPPRQDVEIGVDGFVGDPHRRRFRIALRQPASNLFGGPALREQGEDRRAQAGVDGQLPRLPRAVRPAPRPLVGPDRPIGHGRGVMAGEFARQGARGSVQRLAGGPEAIPRGQHAAHLFALHESQSSIPCHVQLLGSWIDQDTGVALGP